MSEPTTTEMRRYCDGELPLEDARRIEAQIERNPHLAAQADLERRLRRAVADVLQDGTGAPAGLARRIRESIAADAAAPAVPMRGGARRAAHRPWWRAPHRANLFAVAATLSLVGAAVLVGVFGPSIDSWGGRTVDTAAEAAAAVADEHTAAAGDASDQHQLMYRTTEEAGSRLAGWLGGPGGVFDLSNLGYEFAGGNTCDLPHCERGCHLVYRRLGRAGIVSVHVVPDGPHLDLRAEGDLRLPLPTELIPHGAACQRDVLVWCHGQRYYMLVCCVAEDAIPVARAMQEALRAGAGSGQ